MHSKPTRVFVSSTCHDLIDLRAEVERHLRDLGLSPVMSDLPTSDFDTSPNAHSIEVCLVNLRASEVIVFILSQRYGGKLKPFGYPDLSATHVEYREAIKLLDRTDPPPPVIFFYARDRLVADYEVWIKTGWPPKGFRWTREEDTLNFMKERCQFFSGTNWYTPFRTSLELKQRLSFDLRRHSESAILQRMLEKGQVPMLSVEINGLGTNGPRNRVNFVVSQIAGARATSVELRFGDDSWTPVPGWSTAQQSEQALEHLFNRPSERSALYDGIRLPAHRHVQADVGATLYCSVQQKAPSRRSAFRAWVTGEAYESPAAIEGSPHASPAASTRAATGPPFIARCSR